MATIHSAITLIDQITSPVNNMLSALNNLCGAYEDLDSEMENGFDRGRIDAARAAIDQAAQQVDACRQNIEEAEDEQEKFNDALKKGADNANSLQGMIKKAVGALGAAFGIKKIIDFSTNSMSAFNTQLNTETQLMTVLANMVEDDYVLEVMAESNTTSAIADINSIQDNIAGTATITLEAKTEAVERQFETLASKASEIQGRGIYGDEAMIAGAAELSTYFTDTDAVEMMMDTLANYAMGMSGGGALDSSAITNYATGLGKIMSGAYDAMTKKGFEFTDAQKAVIEGTATEAEYVAVLGEQYEAMSDDMRAATAITQVVDEAWGGLYETMSNTPEGKIIQMNNTWGDMQEVIGSRLYPAVLKIVDTITSNWDAIDVVIQGATGGISFIISLLDLILQGIMNVAIFFQDNWSIIEPIIMGIVAALAAYLIVSTAVNTINGIMATVEGVKAAAQMMAAGATFAETAAQQGLNAALMACPITWIIILIIALIAVIYAVCQAIANATGIANSGFGVICGGVMVVIAFFKNLGLAIANIALGIWEALQACGENIYVVFHNCIKGVQAFWYGLLSTVMNVVAGICAALNKIPFINFDYSGITDKAEEYAQKAADANNSKLDYTDVGEAFDRGMHTFETFQSGWAEEAFASGAAWGDGVVDGINSMLDGFGDAVNTDVSGIMGTVNSSQMTSNVSDIADNTARTADALDITDEDLKYLRDIAERDVINRFTTAEISVNLGGITNNVSNDADLDGMIDYIATNLQDVMESTAEGVHA